MQVLVTVSHSSPYDFSDGSTLMAMILSNVNVTYISPQLYSSGTETANDYTAVGVPWSAYVGSPAMFVPSIVQSGLYPSAQTYFSAINITTAGYIQWQQA